MKSAITQIISHASRNPDESRGPITIFFTTEAHPWGYEVSSNDITAARAAGTPEARGRSVLAELLSNFGTGTLTFSETDNLLTGTDGRAVRFASARKLV
jgi:hypothetical protein